LSPYGNFNTLAKRRKREKKTKKLSQFLKVYISETPGAILLQFRMWHTDSRGHRCSKNHPDL